MKFIEYTLGFKLKVWLKKIIEYEPARDPTVPFSGTPKPEIDTKVVPFLGTPIP